MSPETDGGLGHWPLPTAPSPFLAIGRWCSLSDWAYRRWSTQRLFPCRSHGLAPFLSDPLTSTPLPPRLRLRDPPGGSRWSDQREQQSNGSEPRSLCGVSFFVEVEVGTAAVIKHVEVPT